MSWKQWIQGVTRLNGLSVETKIGKILTGVALLFKVLRFLSLLLAFPMGGWFMMDGWYMGGHMGMGHMGMGPHHGYHGFAPYMGMMGGAGGFLWILLQVAGIVLALMGLYETGRGRYRRGGFMILGASLLPPFGILMILGGVLILVSKEGKGSRS